TDLMTALPASTLVDIARQHTQWVHEVQTTEEMPTVLQHAFAAAMTLPGSPVFVAIPWELTIRRLAERTVQLTPPPQKLSDHRADEAAGSSPRCRSSFWVPRRATPMRSSNCQN